MIVAVAPNPSIDKALLIPDFRLGAIHRPEQLVAVAGGKGLNVARTIHSPGRRSARLCPVGRAFWALDRRSTPAGGHSGGDRLGGRGDAYLLLGRRSSIRTAY